MPGSYPCDDARGVGTCGVKVLGYRQCAVPACKHEIGFCAAHGGDERAIVEMTTHITEHRAATPVQLP